MFQDGEAEDVSRGDGGRQFYKSYHLASYSLTRAVLDLYVYWLCGPKRGYLLRSVLFPSDDWSFLTNKNREYLVLF